ncbi:protein of unknown function [Streptomyces sp. KY70]|nr:protein of unknown function [Streptomyces sp. KY70]
MAARAGDPDRGADAVLHHRLRAGLLRRGLRRRRERVRPGRLPAPGPGAPAGRSPAAGGRGGVRDGAAGAAGRAGAPVRGVRAAHGNGSAGAEPSLTHPGPMDRSPRPAGRPARARPHDDAASRLAALAALLADGTRASFCLALLDGRAWTAGELARYASVAPSTASEHLGRLVAGGLLAEERQGRHRYVRLADEGSRGWWRSWPRTPCPARPSRRARCGRRAWPVRWPGGVPATTISPGSSASGSRRR